MALLASRLRSVNKAKPSSRARSTRKQISYREPTSDSDWEEFNGFVSHDDIHTAPSPPQRHRAPPPATTPASPQSKTSKKRKASGPGHRRQNASRKMVKLNKEDDTDLREQKSRAIQFTGKTMPWPTLPYHILLAIFDYASRPLTNPPFQVTSSSSWLLGAALCCKAFTEPALSALYYAPPLYPPSRAHHLLSHLATYKDSSTFNYGAKIKYIDLEAYSTISRKYVGCGPLDLGALVSFTPQLRGIALHLYSDNLAWRKGGETRSVSGGKAVYQRSMVTALQENNVMLQDWTWNHLLAKHSQSAFPLAKMKDVHMMPAFQTLQSLTLVNYPAGPIEKGRICEDMLAEAINRLPRLTDLHFYRSAVNDHLLSKLSHELQTLEIVECPVLKSSSLDGFLAAKGSNMRHLILNHNQSLSLSFLRNLASSCPKFETLKADLRYFSTLNATRVADPKYNALLLDGDRPAWPVTLQALELFHLRKWSIQTAELFFSSLTESAETLPHLRQLRIKASLDESGWRERIAFRDSWTEKLKRVFLRRSSPPNPHLKSISAFKAFKSQQKKGKMVIREEKRKTLTRATASNLNTEGSVQAHQVKPASQTTDRDASDSDSNSDAPLVNVRRSTRAKTHPENFYAFSESPPLEPRAPRRRRRRKGSDDSSSEDSAIDDDGILEPDTHFTSLEPEPELHIQGLCDVVDILIDNLRPAEEQLKEDDFLDEEVSGDEDWNGDDDMSGDDRYAW